MRDPKRITPIINRLHRLWEENPDLRLGQIIGNAFHADPYYVEDELFIVSLEMANRRRN